MLYLRGKVYWYCIKITRTEADGERREDPGAAPGAYHAVARG